MSNQFCKNLMASIRTQGIINVPLARETVSCPIENTEPLENRVILPKNIIYSNIANQNTQTRVQGRCTQFPSIPQGATGATGATGGANRPSSVVSGSAPTGTAGATGPAPMNANIQSLLNKTISSMNSNPEKFKNEADADEDDDEDEGFKSIEEDIEDSKQIEKKKVATTKVSKDTEKQIQKLLNGTDLKNLDTNELLEQQKGLMAAMKHMDPLIKNVNEMISNLKDSPISSFMGLGGNK